MILYITEEKTDTKTIIFGDQIVSIVNIDTKVWGGLPRVVFYLSTDVAICTRVNTSEIADEMLIEIAKNHHFSRPLYFKVYSVEQLNK